MELRINRVRINRSWPVTRMHSSRMRTARALPYGESPWQRPPPWIGTPSLDRDPLPGQRTPPWTETPLPGQRPPFLDRDPPGKRPPGQRPPRQRPPRQRPPQTEIPWTETPLVMWPVVHTGTETPRRLWKHNLAATLLLRAVKMFLDFPVLR